MSFERVRISCRCVGEVQQSLVLTCNGLEVGLLFFEGFQFGEEGFLICFVLVWEMVCDIGDGGRTAAGLLCLFVVSFCLAAKPHDSRSASRRSAGIRVLKDVGEILDNGSFRAAEGTGCRSQSLRRLALCRPMRIVGAVTLTEGITRGGGAPGTAAMLIAGR